MLAKAVPEAQRVPHGPVHRNADDAAIILDAKVDSATLVATSFGERHSGPHLCVEKCIGVFLHVVYDLFVGSARDLHSLEFVLLI